MDPSQYARLPSTPGENSLSQYGGKEGSTSQSRAPSQTPRVGLISSSPPGERFHFLNFPESVFDKASQPRYGHRFGFGTSIDHNDGSAKRSSNDVKHGSRLLINAYGGNDTSHEKLPKVQRLNAYQGMTNLQYNEEDMYAWKNMSPILAIQGKELKLGPPRPNVGSNRQNAALPKKEFKTSRPRQPFLPRPDICANDLLKMQLLTYMRRVVQIFARGVRILDGSYMTQELNFGLHNSEPNSNSDTSTESFASIDDPYVLLRMSDGRIQLLDLDVGLSRSSHERARILDSSYMTQELSFGVHTSETNSNSETSTTVSFASIADPYVLLKMSDESIQLLV